MSTFRVFISSVGLLFVFISCRKEDTLAAGEKLLRRTVSRMSDSIFQSFYHYDEQMRLVAISDTSRGWSPGTTETFIEYDASGNPIKFTHYHHDSYVGNTESGALLIYENGKVIEKRVSSFNNGSYVTTNTYNYDIKGRLIRDSAGKSGYTDFIYDDNDNVVQTNMFIPLSDTMMINTYTLTASYDANVNPYNNLGLTLYFITNSDKLLSKHNRISDTFLGFYDYNTGKYDVNS
jgi:hypothetical protein